MKTFGYPGYVLSIGVTVALLTACGGPQTRSGIGFVPDVARTSWMLPAAKHIKALLYVSDIQTYDVFVYDYKKGTLVGKIAGINAPAGQCVDTKGDVWITSISGDSVVEYAHGGSQPLKTLATDSEPNGCAVDPMSGNLAVSGFATIDVFAHARGEKRTYQSSVCFPLWPPGYDNRGNLYAVGLLYGSARPPSGYTDPLPCELPHGESALRPVHMTFFLSYPGAVLWDGKHLALTDQNYKGQGATGIYRVKEDGSGNLTESGATVLTDDCGGTGPRIPQPFITGHTIVGGDLQCKYYGENPTFGYWAYPAGGSPKSLLQSPPTQPDGESVSVSR